MASSFEKFLFKNSEFITFIMIKCVTHQIIFNLLSFKKKNNQHQLKIGNLMLWLKRSKAACPHKLMLGADAETDYSTKLLVNDKTFGSTEVK